MLWAYKEMWFENGGRVVILLKMVVLVNMQIKQGKLKAILAKDEEETRIEIA